LRAFSPRRDFLLRYTFPTQFRQILILLRALSSTCVLYKSHAGPAEPSAQPGSLRPFASSSQTEVSAPVKLKSEAQAGPIPAWCNGYLIRVLGGRGHTAPPPLPPFTSPSRFLCHTSANVLLDFSILRIKWMYNLGVTEYCTRTWGECICSLTLFVIVDKLKRGSEQPPHPHQAGLILPS
jgi:hypothetical protein